MVCYATLTVVAHLGLVHLFVHLVLSVGLVHSSFGSPGDSFGSISPFGSIFRFGSHLVCFSRSFIWFYQSDWFTHLVWFSLSLVWFYLTVWFTPGLLLPVVRLVLSDGLVHT